jgi:DNA topoisomerase-1
MERIQFGEIMGDEVISRTVNFLDPLLNDFKAKEKEIGVALDKALRASFPRSGVIGRCPVCKTGELIIIRSRKTGKRFIGCTNYNDGTCHFSAPVPQSGTIHPTEKNCQACGFPMIIVKLRGKRPWQLCFNPECKKNCKNERRPEL